MREMKNFQQQAIAAAAIDLEKMTVDAIKEVCPEAKIERSGTDGFLVTVTNNEIADRLFYDFAAAFSRVDRRTPEGIL